MIGIGLGYRRELEPWLWIHRESLDCLEITAEHFFDVEDEQLEKLSRSFPLFVHGLGLSLGTPGPLEDATLNRFAKVAEIAKAQWISEHIAFTRAGGIDLGHLNPIPPTCEMLRVVADHAREVSDRCGRPIILENITSQMRIKGELSETDFLNQLCDRADCGLLLDVTNIYINARNFDFDPLAWLHEIDPSRIVQLHIVGYSQSGSRLEDHHGAPIQEDLLSLLEEVLLYAPVKAVILERDMRLDKFSEIQDEIKRLKAVVDANHART